MFYARYSLDNVTSDDLIWWKEVFGSRAEIDIKYETARFNQYQLHSGRAIHTHFHNEQDISIFLLRFPNAILEIWYDDYDNN